MQLTCPECDSKIESQNINIQHMVAVCGVCNAVFEFSTSEGKNKRRKVKQPADMTVAKSEDLRMAYRTNFRLDKNREFITSSMMVVFFTFTAAIMLNESIVDGMPITLPMIFGLLALFFVYRVLLLIFNKTHIHMKDDVIEVTRKPLPSIFNNIHKVIAYETVAIYAEETPQSVENTYDTPRYNVWAKMENGSRKVIVQDVTEDYGFYIAQQLDQNLYSEENDDIDVSYLADKAPEDKELNETQYGVMSEARSK